MSTFGAVNLINKLSFHLQPRLASLSWLRRVGVRCVSHNTGRSKLPVRYIPKKRRDVNHTQGCTSGDISPIDGMSTSSNSDILGNKALDGTKYARRSSTDGKPSSVSLHEWNQEEYGIGVTDFECIQAPQEVVECMTVPQEVVQRLHIGKGSNQSQEISCLNELSDSELMEEPEEILEETEIYDGGGKGELDGPMACRTRQDAAKLAVGLLAKRAFTAVELRKKLNAKHFPLHIVEDVVRDFLNRGLINDGMYAEMFSQSRWKSSSWGPRRIKQALTKKGVSEVDVENAVKLVFEDGDHRSSMRLSNSSLQRLYEQASKQWQRSQDVPHETRKTRVIRWLQYRGFDWGVVSTILKKLESNHPP